MNEKSSLLLGLLAIKKSISILLSAIYMKPSNPNCKLTNQPAGTKIETSIENDQNFWLALTLFLKIDFKKSCLMILVQAVLDTRDVLTRMSSLSNL